MKLYLCHSNRNAEVNDLLDAIKAAGHRVYTYDTLDEHPDIEEEWNEDAHDGDRFLDGERMYMETEEEAMRWADACLLLSTASSEAIFRAGQMQAYGVPLFIYNLSSTFLPTHVAEKSRANCTTIDGLLGALDKPLREVEKEGGERFAQIRMDLRNAGDSQGKFEPYPATPRVIGSGRVTHKHPLTSFLYELMRDHIPTGVVESMIRREAGLWKECDATGVSYSNPYLANYADELAHVLVDAWGDQRANVEQIARAFHAAYEELAPSLKYETRKASQKPWEDLDEQMQALMLRTIRHVIRDGHIIVGTARVTQKRGISQ